jgi:hypothetical protein
MEIPKGMDTSKNECLISKRTIYGLPSKLVLSLKGCGFMGGLVDLCMWIKHSEFGICHVCCVCRQLPCCWKQRRDTIHETLKIAILV